jgi:uncharacterized heparinase superfamily protein
LNVEADISSQGIWQDRRHSLLWLYNLHYFDDLAAERSADRLDWQSRLVDRWITENPPGVGIGWQPYPSSLRIVNWIKWHLSNGVLGKAARDSLASQARQLEKRLEFHILGNHLLANAKALYFAGAFFGGPESDRWLQKGRQILECEMLEQVLPDGAHFELSPMYHLIVLEDLLDVLNIGKAYDLAPPDGLEDTVRRMLGWSAVMRHGDGDIPFFNDASFGIAQCPAALDSYAAGLGIVSVAEPTSDIMLAASGYTRLNAGDANVYVDAAAVGPDYLPAHAHADTLSFEISIGEERIVVNGGTSVYGDGPDRQVQRGTLAHSTITIDDSNSSDVWAGFRVGRRANVISREISSENGRTVLSAAHDGYKCLNGSPVHRRRFALEPGKLVITDFIEGSGTHRVESRVHLHPSISIGKIAPDGIELITPSGRRIRVSGEPGVTQQPGTWHPAFGSDVENLNLHVGRDVALPYMLQLTFTWET